MKRIIFVLVIASMTILLSGCGNQKLTEDKNIIQPAVEQKENIEQNVVQDNEVVSNTDDATLDKIETREGQGDVVCRENSKYLIITRGSKTGVSDFLIKSKASSDESIACSYVVDKTDFEIKSQDATYFLALTRNFLVLDMGTGPARTLKVYNLNNHKKIFTDNYSNLTSIPNDILQYWRKTTQKATIDNCPKLNEYSNGGLGAIIESYISLDLSTLVKKELGKFRCSPTQ